jgi:hypothetical protein
MESLAVGCMNEFHEKFVVEIIASCCKGTYGSVRLHRVIDGIWLHMWGRVSLDVTVIGNILDNDL